MAKIFITGSTDGLGELTAKKLISQGHEVTLHARNDQRAEASIKNIPGAKAVLTGDLSKPEEIKQLAAKANAAGPYDAIIHNAGVYQVSRNLIFMVNTIAPYVLTCLIQKPRRLIYLSSGMHLQGDSSLATLSPEGQQSNKYPNYSDTKLHDVILSMAVARKWGDVYSNAVNPGWVPTKMGGAGAPDDLEKGYQTQVWLAVSDDAEARVSGRYFHHKKTGHYLPAAGDASVQDKLIKFCENLSGVRFPFDL